MPDAEVKTRLVIEQSGDPQVFREAAAAIRELTAAVQALESTGFTGIASINAQLDQLIAKANEAAAAIAQLSQ